MRFTSQYLIAGLYLVAIILLGACTQPQPQTIQPRISTIVDFSGSWEKNFQVSDNFDEELNFIFFDLQRMIENSERAARSGFAYTGPQPGSINATIGLAQLAEEITRPSTLEISQTDFNIRIEREENFALSCNLRSDNIISSSGTYGSEQCGWNTDRMIFYISLPDGLTILHRVTLSPDRQELNITTTLNSNHANVPFTLSNFYRRFEKAESDFDCTLTLTLNQVCTRASN